VKARWLARLSGLLAVAALLVGPTGVGQAAGPIAWSEPVVVSPPPDGWFPDVAADDRGRVHVVWQGSFPDVAGSIGTEPTQLTAKNISALYYAFSDGKGWSTPRDIALIAPEGHALRSSLTVDAADQLHLIYKGLGRLIPDSLGQEDLWHTVVAGDRGQELAAWQPPVRLTRSTQGYYSDIAIDSKGVVHAIWTESARESWGLYYARSTDGGATWSRRVPLEESGFVWWYRPQMLIDKADRIHVVWELTDTKHLADTRKAVYAISRDGGASWTRTTFDGVPENPSAGMPGGGPQQPAIGVDGSGTILMIYRDPNDSQILFRRSGDGEKWSDPTPLPGIRAGVPRPYDVYATATDSAGHVHLAVVGYPTESEVMSMLYLEWNGGSWSPASVVVSAPPFPEYPRFAISQGNRLHLVWFDGDKSSIDRRPTGIRYTTGLTAAPTVIKPLAAAPEGRRAVATAVPSPAASPAVATARPARSWADSAESGSSWLERAMTQPNFAVAASLAAVAGLLTVVVVARAAAAGVREG
jgi:hypothetical protein